MKKVELLALADSWRREADALRGSGNPYAPDRYDDVRDGKAEAFEECAQALEAFVGKVRSE